MTDKCQCSPEAGSETCELRVLPTEKIVCPTNGKAGKPVDTQTLKAMLALPLTEIRSTQYYFCRDEGCPTVYYGIDGQTFTESQLRERVYQKNPSDGSVNVCYCFRHSPDSIRNELRNTGMTTVVEVIITGIQAGQCACEIRNPQGSCCLGNVNQLLKRLKVEN